MNKPDHTPSSRRTPYQKFSDKVFSLTGMPVGRVATVIFCLLVLGGAIHYAMRGDEQTDNQKSKLEQKKDFLSAVMIPTDFFKSAFPTQIEELNSMIGRCDQLLGQQSGYSDQIQEKRISLLALKVTTLATNGVDPTASIDLLQKSVDQITGSLPQQDKYQFLMVSTYITSLAADPDSDLYTLSLIHI